MKIYIFIIVKEGMDVDATIYKRRGCIFQDN